MHGQPGQLSRAQGLTVKMSEVVVARDPERHASTGRH